jgi:hypothetical protein
MVQVLGQCDGSLLVGGVDDAVEGLAVVGGDRRKADVVETDQVGVHCPEVGSGYRVVDAVSVNDIAEDFEGGLLDVGAVVDHGVTECLGEMGLARAGRAVDDEALVAAKPFEGGQLWLDEFGDRGHDSISGWGRSARPTFWVQVSSPGHRSLAVELG